jgi:hypothetical protein
VPPAVEALASTEEGEFQPKYVHLRLLEAYELAFQDGINPTDAVIAKRLNVRRETITRWRRRNAGLRTWLGDQIGARAGELRPFVDRRVTQLAISGSSEHMRLFYQFVAKVGRPFDDDSPAPGVAACIVNLLCPRPEEYAAAFNQPPASATPMTGSRQLPAMANIPVIASKGPR